MRGFNKFTMKIDLEVCRAKVSRSSLDPLHDKKIGTTRKGFKEMEQELPCLKCIVLAVCKHKKEIKCEIVIKYVRMLRMHGVNLLWIYKDLSDLFPNSHSLTVEW